MVRGVYIQRSGSERLKLENALQRYLREVSPTKKPTTQKAEATKAQQLIQHLGKYSLRSSVIRGDRQLSRYTPGLADQPRPTHEQ